MRTKTDVASEHRKKIRMRCGVAFLMLLCIVTVFYRMILPAFTLSGSGTYLYLYFDNALSRFDTIWYSVDGGPYTQMTRLADVSPSDESYPLRITNVNPQYTYVTADAVQIGTSVTFRGMDSGVIYDAAPLAETPREYGYLYHNFTWTTNPLSVSETAACYYAPALALQYQYTATAAVTSGEEKSEVAMIQQPTGEATTTRPEFYDAAFTLNGMWGKLNDVNTIAANSQVADSEGCYATGDGDSQLQGDVYHAKATFYDYYSDWELSGQPLSACTGGSVGTRGTDSIAYVYSGQGWNEAISDYYNGQPVAPLYFGSNGYFSGQTGEAVIDVTCTTAQYLAKFGVTDGNANHPRFYLWNLIRQGNSGLRYVRAPHGGSHSRAVTGQVQYDFAQEKLSLTSDAQQLPTPYFNSAFLRGENALYTAYGNVYEDVAFDFLYNSSTECYEYDSTLQKNVTRLSRSTVDGSYYMKYTKDGVAKTNAEIKDGHYLFYPFNSSASTNKLFSENLMFGMKLEIPISLYQNGTSGGIFRFSGDDDVWAYCDGQLAMDIGGTHTAVGGVIDFMSGYAVVASSYDASTGGTDGRITATQKKAFAIGTQNGIQNCTEIAQCNATFFNEQYDGFYTAVVDEANRLYTVTLYDDAAGTNPVTTSFLLNPVNPITASATGHFETRKLTIYYMERGLNSSNFKLSFRFLDSKSYTIEKQWADAEDPDNAAAYSNVDLYQGVLEDYEEACTDDTGFVLRVESKSAADAVNHVVAKYLVPDSTVQLETYGNDSDSYVTLALNGVLMTQERFSAYQTIMGLSLSKYDTQTGVTTALNADSLVVHPMNTDGIAAFVYVASTEKLLVQFQAVSGAATGTASNGEVYKFRKAGGCLVELRDYNKNQYMQQNVRGTDSYSALAVTACTEDTASYPFAAQDVRFYIVYTYRYNQVTYAYFVTTIYPNATLDATFQAKADRYMYISQRPLNTKSGEIVKIADGFDWTSLYSNVGASEATTQSHSFAYPAEHMEICFETIDTDREEKRLSQFQGFSCTQNFMVTKQRYSRITAIATVTLWQSNHWQYTWEALPLTDGNAERYAYFALETGHAGSFATYATAYYHTDGTAVAQAALTDSGGTGYRLYAFDAQGYLRIQNTPQIALQVTKIWQDEAGTEMAGTEPVHILLYNDTGAVLRSYTLEAANNWRVTATDLNAYRYDAAQKAYQPVQYYFREAEAFDGYYAVYNKNQQAISGAALTAGGETVTAYPYTMQEDLTRLTVVNRKTANPLFALELKKTAFDDTVVLSGATFQLTAVADDSFPPMVLTTGADGLLHYGSLPYGAYELTELHAPQGHIPLEAPIRITVDADGAVISSTVEDAMYQFTWDADDKSLSGNIRNRISIVMPETGGIGYAYRIYGGIVILILSLLAGMILYVRLLHSERGD